MISRPGFVRRIRAALPVAVLICFILGLAFGCSSDPSDTDPDNDDDPDVGVEDADDMDDAEVDADDDGDACEPLSCDDEELAGQCGEIDDGCGQTIECGCGDHELCDAEDGESGSCICISEWFCEEHGAECGTIAVPEDESCGDRDEVECGSCEDPDECFEPDDIDEELEDEVDPYTCYCIPQDCEELGYDCGMMHDNCGNEIDCNVGVDAPMCGEGENPECVDGQWACVGEDCEPDTTCDDVECGTFTDECGEVQTCGDGECSDIQTCNDAENQCECDEEVMEDSCEADDCTIDDGECTFECVQCSQNCVCEDGDCVPDGGAGLQCAIL